MATAMALLSNAGLGLSRAGIGGRLVEGTTSPARKSTKKSSSPSSSSSRKKKDKSKKHSAPPPAVDRAEELFEATAPPPLEPPVPRSVAKAEVAFEATAPPPPTTPIPRGSSRDQGDDQAWVLSSTITQAADGSIEGTEIGAPSTSIQSPFFDPTADLNGTAVGVIAVGGPPFETSNPSNLGLEGDGGKLGWTVQAINVARSWLSVAAASNFRGKQAPDVSAHLIYTIDWSKGARIPGVVVENGSGKYLGVSDILVKGTGTSESFIPLDAPRNEGIFDLPVDIQAGQTKSIGFEQHEEPFQDTFHSKRVVLRLIAGGEVVPINWDLSLATGDAEQVK